MLLLVLLLLHAFCLTTITITITTAVLIKRGGGEGGDMLSTSMTWFSSQNVSNATSRPLKKDIYIYREREIEREREREKPRQSMQSAIDFRWRKA